VANAVLGMANWAPLYRRWTSGAKLDVVAVGAKAILFGGLAADPRAPFGKPARLVQRAPAKVSPFDRRALDAARREAILMAASALFASRGIGATRVEDVAAAIGLSKRAIYHHIGHKDALVDACVQRAYQFHYEVMDMAERLPATRLEAVFGAVRDVIEAAGDPEIAVLVPFVRSGRLSEGQRQAMNAYADRLADGYRRILVEGQREGSIRRLPVDEVLGSMPGVFSWAAGWPPASGAERGRLADELATLIARGILA
jgi:AcrR family transcriptional regulator